VDVCVEWSRTEDVGVAAVEDVTGREAVDEVDAEEETPQRVRRGCELERVRASGWAVRGLRASLLTGVTGDDSGGDMSQSERGISLKSAKDMGRGRGGGEGA
jgi:hypothetical protein